MGCWGMWADGLTHLLVRTLRRLEHLIAKSAVHLDSSQDEIQDPGCARKPSQITKSRPPGGRARTCGRMAMGRFLN